MTVAANYAGNEERARAFTERTGIKAFRWDVSDHEACLAGVREVEQALGPVDVLVNNAGITRDTTMKRMDHAKWQEVIDTNLGGCFNMAKAVWDGMVGRGYGRIVNIGSINGQAGQYGQTMGTTPVAAGGTAPLYTESTAPAAGGATGDLPGLHRTTQPLEPDGTPSPIDAEGRLTVGDEFGGAGR